MNKETFLQELAEKLSKLSTKERDKVLDYYRELIWDETENGKDEETVIQDFGSPSDIAAQIYSDYTETSQNTSMSMTKKIYSPKDAVQVIQLSAQNLPVIVHKIPEGTIKILFTPLSFDIVDVTEQDTEIFHQPRSITLEIPETFHGILSVKTNNARITVENLQLIKEGTLTTSNAYIKIAKTDCNTLQAHTSNAKVELSDCNGTICNIKTNNGRITISNCKYTTELNLRTNNGAINAEHISSNNIKFQTGNAPINAMIEGDARNYSIHSHTSNGRNNLPANWSFPEQTCRLTAETSNSHIDVNFTNPVT